MIHSTQGKSSDSHLIYITNSEALKLGKTTKKGETKRCKFCGKELETIGFYMPNNPFFKLWISNGEYERCSCAKAQAYWKEFDKRESEKKATEEKAKAENEYREKVERLIRNSNLGERFKSRTFEAFKVNNDNQSAFDTCKRYADNFNDIKGKGTGIIINGSYGAGKTHLAVAIAHEVIRQGYQPIFGTAPNLLDKVRTSYDGGDSKETEQQIINSYINCDLLIIDDLGKEKPTEWTLQKLYQILDTRYEKNKPVIITTNYSMEKLKNRLTVNDNFETAAAIVSRIYEMCQGIVLNCEDYRKKM